MITWRELRQSDAPELARLERICFDDPWPEHAFTDELSNKLARYIVAQDGAEIAAYGGMWLILDEAHINNIAVSPAYRRRGLGEQLVRRLVKIAVSEGAESMTLEVRATNQPALALYKKLGFEPAGRRKGYYSGEDAIIMWNRAIKGMQND